MKKILKKIDKAIIRMFLKPVYYKKCQSESQKILKRGTEAYAEYTEAFIFDSLVNAVQKTPIIFLKTKKIYGINIKYPTLLLRFQAPKVYFTTVLNGLVSKFELRKSSFDKLGRNDKIIIKEKSTGARLQIKKKQYQPDKHELVKIVK